MQFCFEIKLLTTSQLCEHAFDFPPRSVKLSLYLWGRHGNKDAWVYKLLTLTIWRCIASCAASQPVAVPETVKPDPLPNLSPLLFVILVCVSCWSSFIFLPPVPIILPMHFCGAATKISTYPDILRCTRPEYPRANTEKIFQIFQSWKCNWLETCRN